MIKIKKVVRIVANILIVFCIIGLLILFGFEIGKEMVLSYYIPFLCLALYVFLQIVSLNIENRTLKIKIKIIEAKIESTRLGLENKISKSRIEAMKDFIKLANIVNNEQEFTEAMAKLLIKLGRKEVSDTSNCNDKN